MKAGQKNQGERDLKKISTSAGECQAEYGIKMTMLMDEALLKHVMDASDCNRKTETVEMALHKQFRMTRFRRFGTEALTLGRGARSSHLRNGAGRIASRGGVAESLPQP